MYDLDNLLSKEIKEIIDKAPDRCPITGLYKIESYMFHEGVVYGYPMPHDAYTLPEYDKDNKEFIRTKIDMDDDFRRTDEVVCELDDLREREDFKEIKKLYGIVEESELDELFDAYFED